MAHKDGQSETKESWPLVFLRENIKLLLVFSFFFTSSRSFVVFCTSIFVVCHRRSLRWYVWIRARTYRGEVPLLGQHNRKQCSYRGKGHQIIQFEFWENDWIALKNQTNVICETWTNFPNIHDNSLINSVVRRRAIWNSLETCCRPRPDIVYFVAAASLTSFAYFRARNTFYVVVPFLLLNKLK